MMCVELFAVLVAATNDYPMKVEASISAPLGVIGGTGTLRVDVTNVSAEFRGKPSLYVVMHGLVPDDPKLATRDNDGVVQPDLPRMIPGLKAAWEIVVQIRAEDASVEVSVTLDRETISAVVKATLHRNRPNPSPSAPTGPTAGTGTSGATGPTAGTGTSGATGPTASTGTSGATGPTASTGTSSATGPTASTGTSEVTGTTSSTGTSGATGPSDDAAEPDLSDEATPTKHLQVNLGCRSTGAAEWPLFLCAWLLWRARREIGTY